MIKCILSLVLVFTSLVSYSGQFSNTPQFKVEISKTYLAGALLENGESFSDKNPKTEEFLTREKNAYAKEKQSCKSRSRNEIKKFKKMMLDQYEIDAAVVKYKCHVGQDFISGNAGVASTGDSYVVSTIVISFLTK